MARDRESRATLHKIRIHYLPTTMSFNGISLRQGIALSRNLHKHVDDCIRPLIGGAGETVNFNIEASSGTFATARWMFDPTMKQHHITISSRALLCNQKGGNKLGFLRSLANHEAAHALYSERDEMELQRISHGARPLLEMLEDARIESKWRRQVKKKFNWTSTQYFQTVDRSTFNPADILADLITAECKRAAVDDIRRACAGAGHADMFAKVIAFYRRAYDPAISPDTKSLEPIIEDWLKEFGSGASSTSGSGGGMHSKSSSGGGGMPGSPGGSGAATGGIGSGGGGIAGGEMAPSTSSHDEKGAYRNGHFEKGGGEWTKSADNIHAAEVCEVTLREAFRIGDETRFTQSPAPRLDIRHVIGGLPNIFRGVLHSGDDSPMNVRLIIDTSGSMTEPWRRVLGGVVQGMLRLHEAGQMKIDLWLTGNSRFSHIPEPKEEHAYLVATGGGNEYIAGTLTASNAWKPHTEYDAVLVVTDGQITDGDVSREHLSGQDNCLAVYSTGGEHVPASIIKKMREQFPCAIARHDGSSLCEAIVSELVGMRQARLHNAGNAV